MAPNFLSRDRTPASLVYLSSKENILFFICKFISKIFNLLHERHYNSIFKKKIKIEI